MKDKRCSKYFPKQFNPSTTVDDNGYPTYRRRDDGRTVEVKGVPLDNRYVVPYNPTLLYMYQAHINIEKCNHSTAIKYLFKYISKGDDRVVVGLFDRSQQCNGDCVVDEILQYYNCRYVSSCEASWRIFGFDIHHRNPPVERLSFHLPNQQYVVFTSTTDMSSLIDNPRVCESQFLAWMLINKENLHARSLTYSEFPRHYVFEKDKRMWKKRRRGFAIGRISHVSPSAGELYYLRVMLTQVRGPTSFDDIKTVDGVVHKTFKEACFAMGLLDDDKEYISALKEAATWASGYSLRRFFVSMLLCSSIQRPEFVWEQTATLLSDDLFYVPREDPNFAGFHVAGVEKQQAALGEIDSLLRQNGKSLDDFPGIIFDRNSASQHSTNHLILQEMAYNKDELKALANSLTMRFNSDQKYVFEQIMIAVNNSRGGFFFVYGHGGTGKTFLWNALTSILQSRGDIVLAVASSGIAATLLPAGRTAHSRFAIPLQVTETSTCNMNQNSMLAELVRLAKLIIWDEAPMVQRLCVEAFDRSLKDIMHCDRPFGGKCIVMGGDFRQILPVIPQGTRASIVNACITSSYLWKYCTVFQLSQNMRLDTCKTDKGRHRLQAFAKWLLDIGDGNIGHNVDGTSDVDILPDLLVEGGRDPIAAIVAATYESLITNLTSNDYFNERAILAPTVETVNKINKHMCTMLPGEEHVYLSCDSICKSCCDSDSFDDLYTNEFLNTIECSGLPCHRLVLKVGAPIMLLRNIDQASGLCNGTRLRVTKLGRTVVEAITLNGSKPNQRVLIHRMDMNPSESRWPFKMQRRQFPINLSFAMTINKSQGQSLRRVGLLLSRPVFTHGQLYVALSRVRSMDGLKVVVDNGDGNQLTITKNVVYKEIFQNIHIS